jgi:hypothetical protein
MKAFDIAARIASHDPLLDASTISGKLRPLLSQWGPVNFAIMQRNAPSLELLAPNAMATISARELFCLREVAGAAEAFLLDTLGPREQRKLMEALNDLTELLVENETEKEEE